MREVEEGGVDCCCGGLVPNENCGNAGVLAEPLSKLADGCCCCCWVDDAAPNKFSTGCDEVEPNVNGLLGEKLIVVASHCIGFN